ncbi:MAG: hypothetical protein L6Q59_16710, partial [Ignavibacteriaceae bacterium]|nr:hypothetical protein [Ignavibacteriaceae bacterium]
FIREKFDLETGTKLVRFLDSINAGTDSEKQSLLEVSGSSEKLRLFAAIFRKYLPEGKIFLLIDEYDHFTNELISFDQEHFREIVSR